MQELFKNEIILTEELNLQYAEASYKVYRKKYRIGIGIFALVDLVLAGLCLFLYQLTALGVALAVLAVALVILVFYRGYLSGAKKSYGNLKKHYKGVPRMFATFYDDHFERNTNWNTITVDYKDVTGTLETKDLMVVTVGKQGAIQQGILLEKKGFRTGSLEAFLKFLYEKCPQITEKDKKSYLR